MFLPHFDALSELSEYASFSCLLCTVPPESIDPFAEVLPRLNHRLKLRSRLRNDGACQNFTTVLPRLAAGSN